MNNFVKRVCTGVAFVVILLGCIWFHQFSFFALFLLITILASNEFYQIVEKNGSGIEVNKTGGIVASGLLFSAFFFSKASCLAVNPYVGFSVYGLVIIFLIIAELYRKKENPLHNWAYLLLGQVFVALPFSLLNVLIFHKGIFNPTFLLILFVMIWLNDTGAYLFGITLGKHRLFERISPKKSWEGFIGGMLVSFVLAYFLPRIISALPFLTPLSDSMTPLKWLGFALVVVVFGTWGDLTESLLKRTVNIKDSGNILPGHGGLLDRFDSLLMAAPMAVIYLQFVM